MSAQRRVPKVLCDSDIADGPRLLVSDKDRTAPLALAPNACWERKQTNITHTRKITWNPCMAHHCWYASMLNMLGEIRLLWCVGYDGPRPLILSLSAQPCDLSFSLIGLARDASMMSQVISRVRRGLVQSVELRLCSPSQGGFLSFRSADRRGILEQLKRNSPLAHQKPSRVTSKSQIT